MAERDIEKRVSAMHDKAEDKVEALKEQAQQEGISEDKANRLTDRAARIANRAQNREERMRNNQAMSDAFRDSWRGFTNYWKGDFSVDYSDSGATDTQGASGATTTQGNSGATTTQGEGGAITTSVSGIDTNSTTDTQGASGGATDDYAKVLELEEQRRQVKEEAQRLKAEANRQALKEISESNKAYQSLFRRGMEKKEVIALRKERDARSRALANAFGTLINVITSGAVARKGGFAPIITPHNTEPDTNLRKSIEGRYAIENENENLLLSLEKERKAHEAELIKSQLAATEAGIDAAAKAEDDILKTRQEIEGKRIANEKSLERAITLMDERDKRKPKEKNVTRVIRVGGDSETKSKWSGYQVGIFRGITDKVTTTVGSTTSTENRDWGANTSAYNGKINDILKGLKKYELSDEQVKAAAELVVDYLEDDNVDFTAKDIYEAIK